MNETDASARRRRVVARAVMVAAAGAVAAGVLLFLLRERVGEARQLAGESVEWVLGWVRGAGAPVFFTAMAALPVFGFPLSVFSVAAAPAFSGSLGTPLVFVLSGLATLAGLSLQYALARFWMRPWVERLIAWLGRKTPRIPEGSHATVTFLVQVTPGVPFALKGLFLGLMEVPFKTYLLVSWLITYAYVCVFILFADSLARGEGLRAVGAVSAFAALAAGLHLLRKRLAKKTGAPAE